MMSDLISINNIQLRFPIKKYLFFQSVLLIITNVHFNKNDWQILHAMILSLQIFYTSSYSLFVVPDR